MAGKSRRVASRQGELSRRRKRTQRGPSGIPTAPARPQPQQNGGAAPALAVEAAGSAAPSAVAQQQAAPAPSSAVAERPAPRSAAQSRGQARPRGERPTAYNYVGAELRRIGILATVAVAALIAISIVL